jgi:O-antigen/teichoic acid export membrane protein
VPVTPRAPGGRRRGAAPLLLSVAAQAAGNLVLHALVGRRLPAGDYGALGTVLAVMTMLALPLVAVQAAASAMIVEGGPVRRTVAGTLRVTTGTGAFGAGLLLAGAAQLAAFFHLASVADALVLAPFALVAPPLAAVRGMLLGLARTGSVAVSYLAGTVTRLVLGVALVGGLGLRGVLAATVLAEAASLGVVVVAARRAATEPGSGARLRLAAVTRSGVAVSGLFVLSTVDLLLARHYLPGAASGGYVAAATIGKTVLAVPAAAMSVVFPRLVTAWPGPGRLAVLGRSAAVVCGTALLGGVAVALVPGLVLRVLYGDSFAGQGGLVRALVLIAAVSSVVSLCTYCALARAARTMLLPWAAATAEVALIATWHGSAAVLAADSAAATAAAILALVLSELPAWGRRRAWRFMPDSGEDNQG